MEFRGFPEAQKPLIEKKPSLKKKSHPDPDPDDNKYLIYTDRLFLQ